MRRVAARSARERRQRHQPRLPPGLRAPASQARRNGHTARDADAPSRRTTRASARGPPRRVQVPFAWRRTHAGCVRALNEDACLNRARHRRCGRSPTAWAGTTGGEVASAIDRRRARRRRQFAIGVRVSRRCRRDAAATSTPRSSSAPKSATPARWAPPSSRCSRTKATTPACGPATAAPTSIATAHSAA